jgi:LEA14-like dessication related protein
MIRRQALQWSSALILLAGCAALSGQEPLQVHVADLQPLEAMGMELRFLCVLRVQNPNETDLPFRGVALNLQVSGHSFASGVADVSGTVPRFGELLVSVPVTASVLNIAQMAMGLFMGQQQPRVDYALRGRLGSERFESRGELTLPDWAGAQPVPS